LILEDKKKSRRILSDHFIFLILFCENGFAARVSLDSTYYTSIYDYMSSHNYCCCKWLS